jgi:hypothetical protein
MRIALSHKMRFLPSAGRYTCCCAIPCCHGAAVLTVRCVWRVSPQFDGVAPWPLPCTRLFSFTIQPLAGSLFVAVLWGRHKLDARALFCNKTLVNDGI